MTEVARIDVYAGLRDEDLIAGLKRAEAEVKRTAAELERVKAVAHISAEHAEFDDAVANAKRDLRKLNGQRVDPKFTGNTEKLDKDIKKAEAEVKRLDGKKAEVEVRLKGAEKALAAQKAIADAEAANAKAQENHERVLAKAQDERARRDRDYAVQQQRALAENERRTRDLALMQGRAHAEDAKRIREAGVLQTRAYAEDERRASAHMVAERNYGVMQSRAIAEDAKRDAAVRIQAERAVIEQVKRGRTELARGAAPGSQLHIADAQAQARIIALQRQYARLTDQAERVGKQHAFTVEGHAKLDLDRAGIRTKMEALKAELNFLGAHPPVNIEVEMERRRSMGVIRRQFAALGDVGRTALEKAANLGDLTMRLGPFTGTIKQFGLALSVLGPTITDLVGALGSLISVAGAGLAGAATIGAGAVVGFGASFLGLKFATRNTGQEIAQARTSINALQSATLKYGPASDKTKKKQQELNNVMRQISPLARETAKGIESFYKGWDERTHTTQKSLGNIAKGGFSALRSTLPMWAHSTNQLSKTLDTSLRGGFAFIKGPEFKRDFQGITGNFNAMVPSVMHALGNVGRSFLNFGREGSKYLKPLGEGIDRVTGKLLDFTQAKGPDGFAARVKRWVGYARDLMQFFGAAGRVVMHFFSAGEHAGDGFIKTMTGGLNRWDKFLKSADGQHKVADGFDRAVSGAESLWHAIAPIAGAFVAWSSNISPFVNGLFRGVGYVTSLVNWVTKLIGFGGPLAALGTTIGAMWAVGRLGSIIEGLSRVIAALKTIRSLSGAMTVFKGLGSIFSGKGAAGAGMGAGASAAAATLEAGGAAAGAELEAGAAAAAATLARGGALAGAENALSPGGVILPRGAAREAEQTAASLGRVGAEAGVATGAVEGASVASGGLAAALEGVSLGAGLATGGIALVGGAAIIAAVHFLSHKSAADKLSDSLGKINATSADVSQTSGALLSTMNAAGQAMGGYKDSVNRVVNLKKQLSGLKKGTSEYKIVLGQLNDALQTRATGEQNVHKLFATASTLEQRHTKELGNQKDAQKALTSAQKQYNDAQKAAQSASHIGGRAGGIAQQQAAQNLEQAEKRLAAAQKTAAAANDAESTARRRAALGLLNYQRGVEGLIPIAGRAATAMLRLQKTNPNLTAKINVKYADPKDAGRVAASANRALQSGVSSKVVTKIVADSSSAEQAVRRITAKLDGLEAHRYMASIGADDRTANTIGKIVARIQGMPEGKAKVRAIDNATGTIGKIVAKILHIPNKDARLIARDLISGKADAARAAINSLKDKGIVLSARVTGMSEAQRMIALQNSLQDRSVTWTTTTRQNVVKSVMNSTGRRAAGRGPGDAEHAWVGEGHNWKGAKEYIADHATGMVRKVDKPTIMALKPTESVIPTEPRYAARGKRLWAAFAKQIGIGEDMPRFAKGKKPKLPRSLSKPSGAKRTAGVHLSPHGKQNARSGATAKAKKTLGGSGSPKTQPYIDRINADITAENDQSFEIQRQEGKIQAPDTLIKKVGVDSLGNDLWGLDQKAIDDYKVALTGVQSMYDTLKTLIKQTIADVALAMKDIPKIVASSKANASTLLGMMKGATKASNRKGISASQRDAAKEHYKVYKGMYEDEKKITEDASADLATATSEKHDAPLRLETASDSYSKYTEDIKAVDTEAGKEMDAANPQASNADAFTAGNNTLAGLDAESALAAIGQSLNGGPPRTQDQINADIVTANQGIITTGQGLLRDNDPSNDAAAYSAISTAAGVINGIVNPNGTGATPDPSASMPAQYQALGGARGDLFNNFANNFGLAGSLGASSSAFQPGAFGANSAAGGAAGPAQNTTNVVVNNSFPTPPPDPHPFAKGLQFELQAAL